MKELNEMEFEYVTGGYSISVWYWTGYALGKVANAMDKAGNVYYDGAKTSALQPENHQD